MVNSEVVVVIPSLEPTEALNSYVEQLVLCGFENIVIINDGSDSCFDEIFERLNEIKQCTVLQHEKNCGKGCALKTGYQYVKKHLPMCKAVVTADSDGQHAVEDVCKMAAEIMKNPYTMLLGIRDFKQKNTPLKSRVGNGLTSTMFFCLHGKWLPDTQTGLRAFGSQMIETMINVPGERYEYEMQVISNSVTERIPMHAIPIETIYEDGNKGTHYQAIKDSVRIAKVLFGMLGRFVVSSAVSAVVDLLLAWCFMDVLRVFIPSNDFIRILLAVVLARVVSMVVNYCINRNYVFRESKSVKVSGTKYVLLCILNMFLSAFITYLISTMMGVDEKVVKVFGDAVLFIGSYQLQKRWVFPDNRTMRD